MATIHRTTLTPSKLELLTGWLPGRPWFRGGAQPVLTRSGGFRLDDPDGEVGIEVAIVADGRGIRYLVPMTYRGAPLDGADAGLIGTSEHGVLGRRWFYDAAHDPVAVAQFLALITGRATAQHQDLSDTVDAAVDADPVLDVPVQPARPFTVLEEDGRTVIPLEPAGLFLHLVRVLDDLHEADRHTVAGVTTDVPGAGRRPVLLVRRQA